MELLRVENLCKEYERFSLKNISFSLERGYIMGFIGRNGAGKTTTLKSIVNLAHKSEGKVLVDGCLFEENEWICKQKIGFMLGGISCYPRKSLKQIADVTARFYEKWDADEFNRNMKLFDLDPDKKVAALSEGMKVKFSLALALSHHAELLILDEPTSGLDPVSRDELIQLFQTVIEDGAHSILFSTHITSDLEKCADYITYIRNGEMVASKDMTSFLEDYRLVAGKKDQLSALSPYMINYKEHAFGFTGLIYSHQEEKFGACETAPANLDDIMIYCDQEEHHA